MMKQALHSCLITACVLIASTLSAQTLRIYHIDVEQADSALIVMPNGKTLLIDSGKNGHGKRIKAVMDKAGVTQIDAFVDSHYHEDHFGGIDDLQKLGVQILESYDRGRRDLVPAADQATSTFKDYMKAVGEDAHAIKPGDMISLDPLVTVTCVSASGVVINDPTSIPASTDENDLSVTLLINFQGFKAFFGGDTQAPTEAKIAAGDLVMDIDLYKSDHHGSDTSSSQALLSDLKPSLVVISNGSNGSYHHPRQVVLDAYAHLPMPPVVLQTNKCKKGAPCGNVADAFIADPQSSNENGIILITVDAATGSYTARYGANTVRTFQIKSPTAAPPAPTATTASTVVIESLLPNPAGDDEQFEEVTLRNTGTFPVSLAGWTLKDRSGLLWTLMGTVGAGQSQKFRRGGQPMSLNNGGDDIVLLDDTGTERDRFAYTTSSEGKLLITTH
jgi:beta-lactamase superfamily II metal-dependent hydrolase